VSKGGAWWHGCGGTEFDPRLKFFGEVPFPKLALVEQWYSGPKRWKRRRVWNPGRGVRDFLLLSYGEG